MVTSFPPQAQLPRCDATPKRRNSERVTEGSNGDDVDGADQTRGRSPGQSQPNATECVGAWHDLSQTS